MSNKYDFIFYSYFDTFPGCIIKMKDDLQGPLNINAVQYVYVLF